MSLSQHVEEPAQIWRCRRCGERFGASESSFWRRDPRSLRARFVHHAQREHDLDEAEALSIAVEESVSMVPALSLEPPGGPALPLG
jgi:hypothetical protein